MLACAFPVARAAELPLSLMASATRLGELVESSASVRIALETAEGRALSVALRLPSASSRALVERLALPGAEPLRAALEQRLSTIDRIVREVNEYRRSIGAPDLSPEERTFFIGLLSRRALRLSNPSEVTRLYGEAPAELLTRRPEPGSVLVAKQFFVDRDALPAGALAPRPAPLASESAAAEALGDGPSCESAAGAARSLKARLIDWLDEMKACQLRQPPKKAESSAAKWRYFFTGLAVNEAIIAGTYVVGMGEEDVNIEELSTDMLVAAVYMAAGTSVLKPNTPFRVQWFRVTTAIASQDVVDSTVYLLSPLHRLRNGGEGAHTLGEGAERLLFNWSYTWTISGIAEAGLYELVSGLECLYPEAKWMQWAPGALRLTQASISGLVYYSYRHAVIGH